MTIDNLTKHVGVMTESPVDISSDLSLQNGYVTASGLLVTSQPEGYKYALITDLLVGDLLHVAVRATNNIAVISSVNDRRTMYTPLVVGTDGSSVKQGGCF